MNDEEYPLLSEAEEELFGKWFTATMERAYPNPDRAGCPESQILRNIVFRKETDVQKIRTVVSHMSRCSECCMDARAYLDEYGKTSE